MRTVFLVLFVGLMNSCITLNSPHPVTTAFYQSPYFLGYISFLPYAVLQNGTDASKALGLAIIVFGYSMYMGLNQLSNLLMYPSLGETTGWAYKKYSYPILVTDLKEQGKFKEGRACAESILGLFANGDASIEAAKDNNNITKVSSVSQDTTSVLGIFAEVCTIAMGY